MVSSKKSLSTVYSGFIVNLLLVLKGKQSVQMINNFEYD